MLSKSKYSVVFKAISIILLQAFFVSSVSFALAPPSEFEDTGKAFMNRTASAYVLRILAKYLSLGISDHTAKEITQAAIDEILKKAGKPEINLSKTRGDLDPFLYGFELDELEYRESENAYYLPIYRDNGKTLFQHYKFYVDGNDKDADMRISLPGGKFVYVDAIRYDERAEIAARSMRHGKQWYFDVAKATKSMSQLLELLIPEEKSVLKTTLTKLYERLSSVQKNIHELLNSPSKDYADIIISYQDNLVELEAIQIALFRAKKDINSRRYKSPHTEEDKREILEAVLGCVQETIDILTNKIEFSKGKKGTCKTENVGKLLREDDKYIGQFVTEAEDVHVRDINALRLLEALENLLNNADEYGDATLREVSVREADGFCEIEVRDNGKGIDPSLLVEGSIPGRLKLFELGTTTREDGREGGLGTAIVWHFVQDHGGTIDVESLTEEEYKAVTPGDKNIETPISQRSKAYLNENHSVFSARMKELLATTEKLIHKISTDTMLKPDELKSIKKMLLSGNIRDTLRLFEVWETTTHDVFSYPGYFAHVGANITQVLLVEIDKIDAAGGKVSKALGEKIIQALAETRAKILRYNKFLDRIVQNKRITPGTTFTIRLPIGKEKTSENTETPHVQPD